MNDDILDHSDEYQIFFTVSEVDDKGNPYEVMDCRGTWKPKKNKFGDWKKGRYSRYDTGAFSTLCE